MKKTFEVNYWVSLSKTFTVEAENAKEAKAKVKKMIEEEEIDYNSMDYDDDGVEVF